MWKEQKVRWTDLVWHRANIPKHSSIIWIIVLHKPQIAHKLTSRLNALLVRKGKRHKNICTSHVTLQLKWVNEFSRDANFLKPRNYGTHFIDGLWAARREMLSRHLYSGLCCYVLWNRGAQAFHHFQKWKTWCWKWWKQSQRRLQADWSSFANLKTSLQIREIMLSNDRFNACFT